MVEKFKTILQRIEQENGNVSLFALLKMDEFIDKWTIVFSAGWAVPERREEIFKKMKDIIVEVLSSEELQEVARLAIYPKEEHIVEELLQYQSGTVIENQKINGNTVHYANIIKADRSI